jgi:hypothetical protein
VRALQPLTQADMERTTPAAFLFNFIHKMGASSRFTFTASFQILAAWHSNSPLPHSLQPVPTPSLTELGNVTIVNGCVDLTTVESSRATALFGDKWLPGFRTPLTDDEVRLMHALTHTVLEICKEIGIEAALYGGTLIGASRHSGFIPWDDDVDLVVWQPDAWEILEENKQMLASRNIGIAPFGRTGQTYKMFATEKFMPELPRRTTTKYAWRWPFVDLFRCILNEVRGVLICMDNEDTAEIAYRAMFPLRLAFMDTQVLPVPRSLDSVNNFFYGRDWRHSCFSKCYFHPGETMLQRPPGVGKHQQRIECSKIASMIPLSHRLPIDDPLAARVINDTVALMAAKYGVAADVVRAREHGVSVFLKDVCGTPARVTAFLEFDAILANATPTTVCDAFSVLELRKSDSFGLVGDVDPDAPAPRTSLLKVSCVDVAETPLRSVPPMSVYNITFTSHCISSTDLPTVRVPLPLIERDHRFQVGACGAACLSRGYASFTMAPIAKDQLLAACDCVGDMAPFSFVKPVSVGVCEPAGSQLFRAFSFELGRSAAPSPPLPAQAGQMLPMVQFPVGWNQTVGCADSIDETHLVNTSAPLSPLAVALFGDNLVVRCISHCTAAGAPFAVVDGGACACQLEMTAWPCVLRTAFAYRAAPSTAHVFLQEVDAGGLAGVTVLAPCVIAQSDAALPQPAFVHINHADCLRSCLHNGFARAISARNRCACVPISQYHTIRLCDPAYSAASNGNITGQLIEVKLISL